MSVTPLAQPASTIRLQPPAHHDSAPVALVHLPLETSADLQPAATAIYRAARQGRRVVAVAGGADDLIQSLERRLDGIGLEVAGASVSRALIHEPVVLVRGHPHPRSSRRTPGSSPLGDGTRSEGAPAVIQPRAPSEQNRVPAFAGTSGEERPLRVALAGCGVVGGGLIERIAADPRLELVGVLVRDPGRPRHPAVAAHLLATDPATLLAREPDIVIDALSDASTGLALTRASLARGVHVVSAAKQAIGTDLRSLQALANGIGATLAFSAAVGGGAPVIETLQRALAHGPVARIEGVLNGTVNFLLNQLSGGQAFGEALTEARARGFAEEDPSSDLGGHDAAAKIAILSILAFGRAPIVSRETLSVETQLPCGPVRQIARTDGGTASVAFETVGDPLFTDLPDEWNALKVTCADGRVFTCRGRGAGRAPTAESVWADVLDIVEARGPSD